MTTQLSRGAIKSLETKTSSLPPNEKMNIQTDYATEFITNLKNNEKSNLKKFFNEHENINEYQDVEGDTLNTNSFNIPDLLFIDKIIESYDIDMDNKDRPFIEVDAYAIQMTHSERNFYKGCAKCKKKMETEVCMHCSSEESKLFMTISFKIRDATKDMWVDMFGDVAEKFLGMTAEVYEGIIKNGVDNNIELCALNDKVFYQKYKFYGKVRDNTYNEQKRHRFSAYKFNHFRPEDRRAFLKYLKKFV